MSESLKETLEELSAKISEVYDLDLAEEMTDIYIDLVTRTNKASKKYWKLIKALATIEKERDDLRNMLNKEQAIKNTIEKNYRRLGDVALASIEEERNARTQAESDAE